MIREITWTHTQSVRNQSDPSRSPIPQASNWYGTFFSRSLQQTGSSHNIFPTYASHAMTALLKIQKAVNEKQLIFSEKMS